MLFRRTLAHLRTPQAKAAALHRIRMERAARQLDRSLRRLADRVKDQERK